MCGECAFSPEKFLDLCQAVELGFGRIRHLPKAPRTADIDILLWGGAIMNTDRLTIPHPGLLKRRFCLQGVASIMPDLIVPGTSRTIKDHLQEASLTVRSQKLRILPDSKGR
jgi:7,8-dihydro-6-hydroxymethylpterin-pyrophosphokinase